MHKETRCVYTHTHSLSLSRSLECYSAVRKKKILPFTMPWWTFRSLKWNKLDRGRQILCGIIYMGFLDVSAVKNSPANAGDTGDTGLIPGLRRSPGVKNGNSPSILAWKIPSILAWKTPWWATVCSVSKSQTPLSDWGCITFMLTLKSQTPRKG